MTYLLTVVALIAIGMVWIWWESRRAVLAQADELHMRRIKANARAEAAKYNVRRGVKRITEQRRQRGGTDAA